MLALNYEGLTRQDNDLNTVPAAAESWEFNEDATQITFTLRDGLMYSDGSPMTSPSTSATRSSELRSEHRR